MDRVTYKQTDGYGHRHKNKWIESQTYKQLDEVTDTDAHRRKGTEHGRADKQTSINTDGLTRRRTDMKTHRHADRHADQQVRRGTDTQTDRHADRQSR